MLKVQNNKQDKGAIKKSEALESSKMLQVLDWAYDKALKGIPGTKLTQSAIQKISFETIKRINQAVGFRLVTKFGQKGIVNLGKAVPLVGGIIGGGVDLASTKTIGSISKKVFLSN